MTTWFVSRHPGALDWARQQGLAVDRWVPHLEPADVQPGDTVAGTLPVQLAAEVCARGARYLHLRVDLPLHDRGRELDAGELRSRGAQLQRYDIAPHPDGATRNEIDVAFLYRNTMHLIECKTANLGADGNTGDDKATEALYKLDALRKIGGLRTRAMVLDYRGALSAHAANRDRARSAGIEIVAGRQLGDLRGCIQRAWL